MIAFPLLAHSFALNFWPVYPRTMLELDCALEFFADFAADFFAAMPARPGVFLEMRGAEARSPILPALRIYAAPRNAFSVRQTLLPNN